MKRRDDTKDFLLLLYFLVPFWPRTTDAHIRTAVIEREFIFFPLFLSYTSQVSFLLCIARLVLDNLSPHWEKKKKPKGRKEKKRIYTDTTLSKVQPASDIYVVRIFDWLFLSSAEADFQWTGQFSNLLHNREFNPTAIRTHIRYIYSAGTGLWGRDEKKTDNIMTTAAHLHNTNSSICGAAGLL